MALKRVTMDFETRSRVNLKTAGAYKYSLDPSTQPTCLSFKVLGNKTVYFLPFEIINLPWGRLPETFINMWTEFILTGYQFSGHNAFFETCIYKNILVKRCGWPDIPFRSFRCTAAKAAACALPRALGDAGEAVKLRIQKDKRGYNAMMATCKPTRQWNEWKNIQDKIKSGARITEKTRAKGLKPEPPMFLEPLPMDEINAILENPNGRPVDLHYRAQVWKTLYTYCKIDTRSEEELDEYLPDLMPLEQEIWFLNQKLNWRGLHIDIPTVRKIVDMMEVESTKKLKELDALTMGLVTKPGARKSILEFLALDDIILPDLRAKTVDDALQGFTLSEDMFRLLEIRKALSKTSTRKYQAFLNRANEDDRVRDILMYHGASTGRDTGTGVQPHNFPRGIIKVDKNRPYAAVENVVECDPAMLQVLYGDSLAVLFSSILRNMIIPTEGRELFVADFSKIEVAVLWWLADNGPGLDILRSGKDPYKYQAAQNTSKKYEDIADDSDARQLGKAQILGCGFGMGGDKFQTTAWEQYRLKLTLTQSRKAVRSYRTANAAVPELWEEYESAAIEAVENKGHSVPAGKCEFFWAEDFLWIQLPSGRRLAYRDPRVVWRERVYEVSEIEMVNGEEIITKVKKVSEPKKTLEFWAVNSKTKKWTPERTWGGTLTENIVQSTARDLMMPAMLRLEKAEYYALLMVHDEGICERDIGKGDIEEFVKILCEPPAWADGLPLSANGWRGPRYRK